MNGWYAFTETSGGTSFEVKCVFFEDGMFIYHFNPAYFKETADKKNGFYSRGTQWGRYVLVGDTIKAQFIESPGGMSWSKGHIWFQIANRTSLKWLAFKYGDPIHVANIGQYQNRDMSIGSFTSAPAMPNADKAWIKSRSWFWCDIQKFKVWKQQRK
ncbi:hypothetical protein GCM10010967_12870 [Dyadobacter beijingensis]|uniref:Uncharacterized protein n=1 Tax=Dyadobacter beijingensis TaxID=365489 RepID=A0ABQ2HJE5_9BACT|nr:hypothetical protein GCM10010967_12870 [Dyadobacter beijingensis]